MGEFNGEEVFLKRGRFGPYIQAGKKMKSLLPGMNEEDVTEDIAKAIISLPTDLGKHPETGESVLKDIGRYGPYVKSGRSNGSIPTDINLLEVTLEQAISYLKAKASGPKVLKELGKDTDDKAIEVKDGRYGAYITNGKINATIPKGTDPNSITLEQALEMIKAKIAKGPTKRRVKRKK
jgi:DNA topoisomerase-1